MEFLDSNLKTGKNTTMYDLIDFNEDFDEDENLIENYYENIEYLKKFIYQENNNNQDKINNLQNTLFLDLKGAQILEYKIVYDHFNKYYNNNTKTHDIKNQEDMLFNQLFGIAGTGKSEVIKSLINLLGDNVMISA